MCDGGDCSAAVVAIKSYGCIYIFAETALRREMMNKVVVKEAINTWSLAETDDTELS